MACCGRATPRGTHLKLILFFLRDYLLVICQAVTVCSTLLISSVETLLRLMSTTTTEEALEQSLNVSQLLLFYYVTLGLFLVVCVLVLAYFCIRFLWELTILRHGAGVEHRTWASCCFVSSLKFTLYAAVLLLVGLFVAYWAFWGTLLNSLRWRMQVVLSRIAPSSPDATRALAEAANRTFLVVVFFVLSISLNILTLLRQLLNKTVLLRTTQRASIFRLVHVDLKRVEATPGVFRSLFASFLFDLLELWTLSSWILYPIFVAVFWTLESSCVESELALAASSISPLIACMYVARFHLLAVAIGWCGLVTGLSLMYFFRYLDERRKLVAIDSKSRWWHQSPFVLLTVLLFLAGCAAAILSAVMLGKPLLSNQSETTRVTMAVPGVVLMCGSLLLLFHLGRKLVASWRWSKTPHVSFFFERGCALSGNNPDTPLASAETDVDLDEIGTPYMRATNDEILF